MFGKIFSKIHSEHCQTSKMDIFPKIVNYQKPLTSLIGF